ncbi:Uncharacterised protein [Mycobacteroides abscessus subsp. massiliense]|nr:Uncharacterised protein [Mycobacteroides abscessus subsp. massiliense]
MGVAADEQRPTNTLCIPVFDDRGGGGHDMRLVEGSVETRSTMSRRPERDLLGHVRRVGLDRVIRGHHMGDVDEVFRLGRLSGARVAHTPDSARIR